MTDTALDDSAIREDVESLNSDDEAERIRQECACNKMEMEDGDFQTYVHALFEHIRQYLAQTGSSLLDKCTFPAFFDYCRAEYKNRLSHK